MITTAGGYYHRLLLPQVVTTIGAYYRRYRHNRASIVSTSPPKLGGVRGGLNEWLLYLTYYLHVPKK